MLQSFLLPQIGGYTDGSWRSADNSEAFQVTNPATGATLATVNSMDDRDSITAIEAAGHAMRAAPPLEERRQWLERIGAQLLEHKQEIGRIITLEHGKPWREGIVEAEYAAGFFHFFSQQLSHLSPSELRGEQKGCRWKVYYRPAGVVGSITPWNFPLAMMAKKIAPALAAGCGVVARPSSLTPLSAMAFAAICDGARLTPGMFNLVVGHPERIAAVLCRHPQVRLISFTGSTSVGKKLAANTAPHVKRLALELGGNAPFIVFPDADLEASADHLIANKFRAGGQTCVCANRVLVHEDVAASFTAKVAERVSKLRVGNGLDEGTDVGPLIHRGAFDKVAEHVRDALEQGARRIVGRDPKRPKYDWGAFYPPTLLAEVRPQMKVCREETFGPVVAIIQFRDEDEVVRLANDTEYGLAAYLFTADAQRAERILAALSFGHVGVNTGAGPTPQAPFGGMKQSGYGREGGLEGLLEFCEPQTVAHVG